MSLVPKFEPRDPHPESTAALERTVKPWVGTPYRAGHQAAGIGADCRSFVLAQLDAMYGLTTDIGALPSDAALHQPAQAVAFLRSMARRFGAKPLDPEDLSVEPGDLIITAIHGGGPTHVVLALTWPYFADCVQFHGGVRRGGFSLEGLEYRATYRLPNKNTWQR